jgi:hypothetical protein
MIQISPTHLVSLRDFLIPLQVLLISLFTWSFIKGLLVLSSILHGI